MPTKLDFKFIIIDNEQFKIIDNEKKLVDTDLKIIPDEFRNNLYAVSGEKSSIFSISYTTVMTYFRKMFDDHKSNINDFLKKK